MPGEEAEQEEEQELEEGEVRGPGCSTSSDKSHRIELQAANQQDLIPGFSIAADGSIVRSSMELPAAQCSTVPPSETTEQQEVAQQHMDLAAALLDDVNNREV